MRRRRRDAEQTGKGDQGGKTMNPNNTNRKHPLKYFGKGSCTSFRTFTANGRLVMGSASNSNKTHDLQSHIYLEDVAGRVKSFTVTVNEAVDVVSSIGLDASVAVPAVVTVICAV